MNLFILQWNILSRNPKYGNDYLKEKEVHYFIV